MQDEDGHIFFPSQAIDRGAVLHRKSKYDPFTPLGTHLPVSPLVAPTTVSLSGCSPGDLRAFLLARKNSKRLPRSCSATSLNAKVGP